MYYFYGYCKATENASCRGCIYIASYRFSESEMSLKTSINIKTKTDIKNILKTVKKTEYFDYWLTGFLNGEVSFTFSKKSGRKAIPIIFLEHTDKDIMY